MDSTATESPSAALVEQFSSPGATARPWSEARDVLERAEIYWISTVRRDGRPHVTPLMALYLDDALHFCTGAEEQKALNLASNPHCAITTGCNSIGEGFDVVVEGAVVRVVDANVLGRAAKAYKAKYGWEFTTADGMLHSDDGGDALLFRVQPSKALGFGKGETFSQTRWRFSET